MARLSAPLAVPLAGAALFGGSTRSSSAADGDLQLALVGNFSAPTYITAPSGDGTRLFIVEKAGRIRLIKNGAAPALFLDISARVDSNEFERGLLSMAFAPDYATSGLFYVYYTTQAITGPPAIANGTLMIVEFGRSTADPDVADVATARTVIAIPHAHRDQHPVGLQRGQRGSVLPVHVPAGCAHDPCAVLGWRDELELHGRRRPAAASASASASAATPTTTAPATYGCALSRAGCGRREARDGTSTDSAGQMLDRPPALRPLEEGARPCDLAEPPGRRPLGPRRARQRERQSRP